MFWDLGADFWLTRLCLQRAIAFLYLIAFLIVINQFCPLVGEKGLLPASPFLRQVRFWEAPSLFHFHHSDRLFRALGWVGVVLSLIALSGLSERHGLLLSMAVWATLWGLYLSFIHIGQTFYGFGWEMLLAETGFLMIFLGSRDVTPPVLVIWLFRWLLFRVMFGAGMIKLRGDACWRDLTCMDYHYETQPLPGPLSWYFHHLPQWFHRAEVAFTHVVELVVPWGYFVPGPVGWAAAGLTVVFQSVLILSGNLSWLNYITIALCIPCFDDRVLSRLFGPRESGLALSMPFAHQITVGVLTAVILYLSYRPARNLISRSQLMNASFDPLHLVNTYGAFGSITRRRLEVVIEGTDERFVTSQTQWREYELKGKPGAVSRRPPLVSPYHYKLDWQMWFAAMSPYWNHPWILNLVAKLLANDKAVLGLIAFNPFAQKPPTHIRMQLYHYRYTDGKDPNWWQRTLVKNYLPPVALDDPEFREVLRQMEWE